MISRAIESSIRLTIQHYNTIYFLHIGFIKVNIGDKNSIARKCEYENFKSNI